MLLLRKAGEPTLLEGVLSERRKLRYHRPKSDSAPSLIRFWKLGRGRCCSLTCELGWCAAGPVAGQVRGAAVTGT